MDFNARMNQIKEHFRNLTIEEFDTKLERAGIGVIEPSFKNDMEIVEENELYISSGYPTMGDEDFNIFLTTYAIGVAA